MTLTPQARERLASLAEGYEIREARWARVRRWIVAHMKGDATTPIPSPGMNAPAPGSETGG